MFCSAAGRGAEGGAEGPPQPSDFIPPMENVLYIIGSVAAVIVVVLAAVFFGIPGWAPSGRKPDKEMLTVIAVILGLIIVIILGVVVRKIIIQ